MDTTEDDKRAAAKRRAAEHDAEMLQAAASRSALPDDPSLPADARALRAAGLTPLERLDKHAAGLNPYDGDMTRMAADKAMLPYTHRTPDARATLSIDHSAMADHMTQALLAQLRAGTLSEGELDAMPSSLGGQVH